MLCRVAHMPEQFLVEESGTETIEKFWLAVKHQEVIKGFQGNGTCEVPAFALRVLAAAVQV